MIDPLMNPPQELIEFKLASEVALAEDEFAMKYIEFWRSKSAYRRPRPGSRQGDIPDW